MKKLIPIYFLLATLISCGDSASTLYIPPKVLLNSEKNRVIELKLDSMTSCHIVRPVFLSFDGVQCLAIRKKLNAILYYDFNSGKLQKSLVFNTRANNRIGEVFDYLHFSPDTILIKGKSPIGFYLVNKTGDVFGGISFGEEGNSKYVGAGLNYMISAFKGDVFYSCGTNPIWTNPKKSPAGYERPPFWAFNLLKNKSRELKFGFPKDYFTDGFWSIAHTEIGFCADDKGLVMTFPASPDLHTYRNGVLQSHPAAAEENPKIEPEKKQYDDVKAVAECYNYFIISYDSYRKRYYRFLFKPIPEGRNIDNLTMANVYAYKPCTILIFDENFKKLGEYDLPDNRFFVIDHFVAPDGLYISENHPENPELNEDILRFRKISFDFDEK